MAATSGDWSNALPRCSSGIGETLGLSLHLEADVRDDIPVLVAPRLWIGSIRASYNSDALAERGITHVLNLTDTDFIYPTSFTYLAIRLRDRTSSDILTLITASNVFINAGVTAGGVLVHCVYGRSRSPSLVIAFMMSHFKYTYAVALEAVQRARRVVQPNKGFEEQLIAYEKSGYDVFAARQVVLRQRLERSRVEWLEAQGDASRHSDGRSDAPLTRPPSFVYKRRGSASVRIIPMLRGFETMMCCASCKECLFLTGSVLRHKSGSRRSRPRRGNDGDARTFAASDTYSSGIDDTLGSSRGTVSLRAVGSSDSGTDCDAGGRRGDGAPLLSVRRAGAFDWDDRRVPGTPTHGDAVRKGASFRERCRSEGDSTAARVPVRPSKSQPSQLRQASGASEGSGSTSTVDTDSDDNDDCDAGTATAESAELWLDSVATEPAMDSGTAAVDGSLLALLARSAADNEAFMRTYETLGAGKDGVARSVAEADAAATSLVTCGVVFLEQLPWMGTLAADEGSLCCPRCRASVGWYDWHGGQCRCGAFEEPALCVKLDTVEVAGDGVTSIAE